MILALSLLKVIKVLPSNSTHSYEVDKGKHGILYFAQTSNYCWCSHQFSQHHSYISYMNGSENLHLNLRSERVKPVYISVVDWISINYRVTGLLFTCLAFWVAWQCRLALVVFFCYHHPPPIYFSTDLFSVRPPLLIVHWLLQCDHPSLFLHWLIQCDGCWGSVWGLMAGLQG